MIRRLLCILILLAAPAVMAAGTRQQTTLLTPEGTLYTLESDFAFNYEGEPGGQRILKLITQHNGETTEAYMPFTLLGGWHGSPSIAYDEQTDTLFAFWEHSRSLVASELLIASYRDGAWSEPVSINSTSFRLRTNLKIATSHFSEVRNEDGELERIPSLVVHAIYWEQTGDEESAHYAMIPVREGRLSNIEQRPLITWALSQGNPLPVDVPEDYDFDIFRRPAIFESLDRASVDIIFGDVPRTRFHRITVRPIREDGVLDVPIGIWHGEINPPGREIAIQGASTKMLVSGETIAFYAMDAAELRYQLHRNGKWQDVRVVKATSSIPTTTALDALSRLVTAEPR